MRSVTLDALVRSVAAPTVFDGLVRFERYPQLAPHVQATTVHHGAPDATGRSSWQLHFRSGLLRWTEAEVFDRDALRIDFRQETGDFDEFAGSWDLRQRGTDCEVGFRAEFDFGIPSLAGILDPIAERVIRESVAWVLTGMFPRTELATAVGLPPTALPRTT